MAVFQDVLETYLVLKGAAEFIGGLSEAKTAVDLLTGAIQNFMNESRKLFETGVILKNTMSSLTLPGVRAFAQETSETTGLPRAGIEGTAGVLARTGIAGSQIQSLLKATADTSVATGRSFEDTGRAIERGVLGHMRGLMEFGIALQDTNSKAANAALIYQQLLIRFEGAAKAFRETLPGAVMEFQSAWARFTSDLVERFAPMMIRVLHMLTAVLDFFGQHIEEVFNFIANLLGGPIGVFLLQLARLAAASDPMAQVGHGGDPATEETAQEIADNTRRMADSVEAQVLGGSGEIVRQSFGYLHARLAMNI